MNTLEFKISTHDSISGNDLREVCKLKDSIWPHGVPKQLEWMARNMKSQDIHIIALDGSEIAAYCSLKNISLRVNGNMETKALGLGNVCASIKGKGYGGELIKYVNRLLSSDIKQIGVLFCKDDLVNFYSKYNWRYVKTYFSDEKNTDVHMLCFNLPSSLTEIVYEAELF